MAIILPNAMGTMAANRKTDFQLKLSYLSFRKPMQTYLHR